MKFTINFWGTIFYLILIVCGILVAGLAIQLASTLVPPHSLSTGLMQHVAESTELAPIQDLIISQAEECPVGFEIHRVGFWPGNRYGCYIQKGVIGESCIEPDIPSLPPKNIMKWGNLTFCVQRNRNYQFGANIQCDPDYMLCSKDLCVSKQEKCPITEISTHTQEEFEEENSSNKDWLNLYNRGKMLKLHRDFDPDPIYNLEVSFRGKPCYAKGWMPFKEIPYQLLDVNFGCGVYGEDPNASILDSMKEKDLYLANPGFDEVLIQLKGYNESIEHDEVYLVTRQRIELRQLPICYEHHIEENEINNLEILDQYGEWIFTLSILELLTVVPLIMFLYRDIKRKGALKRLIVANKLGLLNPIYYAATIFYLRIYVVLAGVKDSSTNFLVLAAQNCFVESKLKDAAIDFASLVKDSYFPNYTKVSLIVAFLISRIIGSIVMSFYIEAEKKKGYNPNEVRNKSETEIQWFAPPKEEKERQYMSI